MALCIRVCLRVCLRMSWHQRGLVIATTFDVGLLHLRKQRHLYQKGAKNT